MESESSGQPLFSHLTDQTWGSLDRGKCPHACGTGGLSLRWHIRTSFQDRKVTCKLEEMLEAHMAKTVSGLAWHWLTWKVDLGEVVKAQRETGQRVWEDTDPISVASWHQTALWVIYPNKQMVLIWNLSWVTMAKYEDLHKRLFVEDYWQWANRIKLSWLDSFANPMIQKHINSTVRCWLEYMHKMSVQKKALHPRGPCMLLFTNIFY